MATSGRTVFDGAEVVADKVNVGTGSELAFVWSATAPSNGLTAAGKEFRVGYNKTPSYLQIDSGTYSFGKVMIGYSADTTAGLTLNDGTFITSGENVIGSAANTTASLTVNGGSFIATNNTTRIGYADGVKAEVTVNGGTFETIKVRVGGGKSGVDGTLTIKGGEFRTTSTETSDVFMICDQANTRGTLVLDGGTLDTTSCGYTQMGGMTNTTATILMKDGTWNTKSFIVGGKTRTSASSATNAVARVVVEGGTINASEGVYIGTTVGTDTLSEMVVSNGTVSVGGDIYLGNVANATASLTVNGGLFTTGSANVTRIGNANGVTAELTVDGGTFETGKARVGGASGSDGTLTIKSGEFRTAATGAGVFIVCNEANTRGTVVVDGGTLDTTSGEQTQIGGVNEIEANIYVNTGGVWNASGFFLGGKKASTKYDVTNAVTRLYVNGGTVNLSGISGIGYAVGEGSSAEMVLNDGAVTISGADAFYVGESGPGSFTMNGGVFTMVEQSTGFGFGHKKNGSDVGIVTLNGGVLNIYRFRLDYVQPGSKLIFNGGTVKPTKSREDFLDANANLKCVIDDGGLIVDTAGHDITITHPFVAADGKTIGGITKKGSGKLTLTEPFDGSITVLRGSVFTNLVTVGENDTLVTNQVELTATPPAETKRYWLGATADGLASDIANWSTSSGGTSGASAPEWNCVYSTIYFNKAYANGVTVFDKAIEPVKINNLKVGASSEASLVWRATLPYCGFSYISGDWILAYDSSHKKANLTIDSGTYACASTFRVGYAENANAKVLMNGGSVSVANGRVGGGVESGSTGSSGTLVISNGTFTATSSLYLVSGNKSGGSGTLVVDGGTLVTTGVDPVYIGQSGKQSTATLVVSNGIWNAKSFLVGGEKKKTANSYAGLMSSLIVDGGTVNASGDCQIGANIAEDARSEMIVNAGSVNIKSSSLYVGDGGPGYLTINGGSLAMKDTNYGLSFGHLTNNCTGVDFGVVTLNGGTLTIPKFRVDYVAPGSKLVFNGGTVKATRNQPDFLPASDSLTCEMQEGGIVFDTASFDVTNAHDIVWADGVTKTKVVKKGDGELTFTGEIDPNGEFSVEAGKLTLLNLSRTKVERISVSVSDGAVLDLGGSEVTAKEYWLNGKRQRAGSYTVPNGNGTIRVLPGAIGIIR